MNDINPNDFEFVNQVHKHLIPANNLIIVAKMNGNQFYECRTDMFLEEWQNPVLTDLSWAKPFVKITISNIVEDITMYSEENNHVYAEDFINVIADANETEDYDYDVEVNPLKLTINFIDDENGNFGVDNSTEAVDPASETKQNCFVNDVASVPLHNGGKQDFIAEFIKAKDKRLYIETTINDNLLVGFELFVQVPSANKSPISINDFGWLDIILKSATTYAVDYATRTYPDNNPFYKNIKSGTDAEYTYKLIIKDMSKYNSLHIDIDFYIPNADVEDRYKFKPNKHNFRNKANQLLTNDEVNELVNHAVDILVLTDKALKITDRTNKYESNTHGEDGNIYCWFGEIINHLHNELSHDNFTFLIKQELERRNLMLKDINYVNISHEGSK